MTPNLGFPAIAAVGDSAAWKLGDIIRATDPVYGAGEFIYLKGVGSTVRGSAVTYNADDFTSTLLAANAIGPVAVAMAATVANKYGWYQISGKGVVKAGTVADDGNVYATGTPGQVDDAVVAGDRVKNAKFASADGTPSAGLAEIELARPWMDDAVAA
ncbi:hypothetical protein ASD50_20700 [Mesorhizobium sp. Root552]|nr:hypothetical protein ASD50_20700 [Mesorhizobium sp. Root552]